MKNFTRRELLRTLAAVPALAFIEPLARATPGFSEQFTTSPFQRLNIIIHGMSVIDFSGDEVHVYLPTGPSDYAYLAGTWMQEVVLTRGGEYRLSGVMTGPRPELRMIDPRQNAVYKKRAIDPAASFCQLVLPFPDFFTPLRLLHKRHRKEFFIGSPRPILDPSALPLVVVLTYVHPDSTSALQFRPLRWTPVIEDGAVNLHVWDAPAKEPSQQEARNSFRQMTKTIRSPALELDPFYAEIDQPLPDENPSVPGLSCQEEWTLVERLGQPASCGRRRKRQSKESPFDNLSLILY